MIHPRMHAWTLHTFPILMHSKWTATAIQQLCRAAFAGQTEAVPCSRGVLPQEALGLIEGAGGSSIRATVAVWAASAPAQPCPPSLRGLMLARRSHVIA